LLDVRRSHIVLVEPSDNGNLGSIIRSAVGFGLTDIAVVGLSADAFDPHVIRASMGALFSARIQLFEKFDEYLATYSGRSLYPFMLGGANSLPEMRCRVRPPYSLIFGNEGTGLPPEYAGYGEPVIIPHSHSIDSLNLAAAASIAAYVFRQYELEGAE